MSSSPPPPPPKKPREARVATLVVGNHAIERRHVAQLANKLRVSETALELAHQAGGQLLRLSGE
jgi:conjugal transfer/entry exclusion protein